MSIDESETTPEWLSRDPQGRAAWIRIAKFRVAAALVLPILIMLVPSLGPHRIQVVAVTGTAAIISNLALLLHARRGGVLGLPIAVVDTAMMIIFVTLVPVAYVPGLILLISVLALCVFWIGRRQTILLAVLGVSGFLGAGVMHHPDDWVVALLAFAFATTILIATTSNVADAATRANQRYDAMVNGIDAVVWEASGLQMDPQFFNSQVDRVLGITVEECRVPGFLSSRVHSDDLDAYLESRRDVMSGSNADIQYRIRDHRGMTRYLHERITVSLDEDGRPSRRGVIVDETARSVAEASLRGYDDFIAGAPTAMAILRLDDLDDSSSMRIVSGNPAAADLLGVTVEGAIGALLSDVIPDIPIFTSRLANVVILNTSLEAPAIRLPDSDSVYSLRAIPLPDQCVGVTLDDVTKAARTAETLKHQALHDHLTGLPNRAHFNERLARALKIQESDGESSGIAVLMIDLNKFKDVNDNLGHEYGDKLLIELAKRLARNIRGCDTIARLGGDEFAILILAAEVQRVAKDVADRIETLVAEPFLIDEYVLQIGASVGVAVHDSTIRSPGDLLKNADNAMYRAKSLGGGTIVFGDVVEIGDSQISLAEELGPALNSEQFEVLYQPRIELSSMEAVGIEALVRWRHPRLGLLEPARFLDIAEAGGMVGALTRFVAERAISDLGRLSQIDLRGNHRSLSLTLNVSQVNLNDPLFVTMLEQMAQRAGLPTRQIRVDISEGQFAQNISESIAGLHSLRHGGIGLTLDRFGLGRTSVPLIFDLPIDEIKIDRSIVSDLDSGTETIVRAIINLGHELGLSVAANGVENSSLATKLEQLGCDTAQGYFFAPPMDFTSLQKFLSAPTLATSRTTGA